MISHTYQAFVYIRLFQILADTCDERFAVLEVGIKVGNVSDRSRRCFYLWLFVGKGNGLKLLHITNSIVQGRHLAWYPSDLWGLHWKCQVLPYPRRHTYKDDDIIFCFWRSFSLSFFRVRGISHVSEMFDWFKSFNLSFNFLRQFEK